MNEQELITYYNKFNEDKRLNSRHGKIEFLTTIKYIKDYLKNFNNPKILDIGAGTGAYSSFLQNEGYDITAIELVKHNLRVIESKNIKCMLGNALDLSKFNDEVFDVILLLGPMYHLMSEDDKIKCLKESKRVLKNNGIIFVAYITNEYAVITHAFKEKEILNSIKNKRLDNNYHVKSYKDDLYSYVRIEDINEYNKKANLKRIKLISPDTFVNYFRTYVNKLTDEEFEELIKYNFSICERKDILGMSSHLLDIIKK